MNTSDPQLLVSTDWLATHLDAPDIRILDASWHMPDSGRNPTEEYAAAHIPGAHFFDVDEISDTGSSLPHMAPPTEKFVARLRAKGIGDGHRVVVYDTLGLFSAARVWWLFRLFGKRDVAVLDGGLPKWLAEGRPVDARSIGGDTRSLAVLRRAGKSPAGAIRAAGVQAITAKRGCRIGVCPRERQRLLAIDRGTCVLAVLQRLLAIDRGTCVLAVLSCVLAGTPQIGEWT
jgi:thiosulfate/3-mercaptopyruvate sulfurtransferase